MSGTLAAQPGEGTLTRRIIGARDTRYSGYIRAARAALPNL
jgi:hypothetical protein